MLEEKIIRSFHIKLQKENNVPIDLLSLSQLVEEFLEFTLGKDYDFPINPFQIAEQLGMWVTLCNINQYRDLEKDSLTYGIVIHHKFSFSHSNTFNTTTQIENDVIGLEKNYERTTLFYLIAAFLLHYEENFRFSYYNGIDLLHKMPKDYIFLNNISCFLAMPYHLTKKEILKSEENRTSIFYDYFRNVSGITHSHTVSSLNQFYTLESLLLYEKNSKE